MKNGLYKALTWRMSKTTRRIMLGDELGMNRICAENGIATVPILMVAEAGELDTVRTSGRAGAGASSSRGSRRARAVSRSSLFRRKIPLREWRSVRS